MTLEEELKDSEVGPEDTWRKVFRWRQQHVWESCGREYARLSQGPQGYQQLEKISQQEYIGWEQAG